MTRTDHVHGGNARAMLRDLVNAAETSARSYTKRGLAKGRGIPCGTRNSAPRCDGSALHGPSGCYCKAPGIEERDRLLGSSAGMLALLGDLYAAACALVDRDGPLVEADRRRDPLCVAVDAARGMTAVEAIAERKGRDEQ